MPVVPCLSIVELLLPTTKAHSGCSDVSSGAFHLETSVAGFVGNGESYLGFYHKQKDHEKRCSCRLK